MIARSSEPLRAWFQFWDLAATALAWLAADFVRLRSGWVPITAPDTPEFELCVGQLPLVTILGIVAYRVSQMYDVTRLSRFREELYHVAKGVGFLTLLIVAITFAMQSPYRPRAVFALFTPFTIVGIVLARRLSWFALGRLRARGYNQSHALIVGTGRLARTTARTLESAAWMGIQTVAYVDDEPDQPRMNLPVVGPFADLPRLVAEMHIEHVFIALPMNRYGDVRRVFDALSQTTVEMRLIADAPAMSALSLTTTNLNGMTVLGLRENRHFGANVAIKRVMDFTLALVGLVVLSPVLALIALLVKLSSKGPVLYRQERCSLDGRRFQMLKFRSMRPDSEAKTGAVWTAKNDPRCTRIGAIIRKTNLDELPQLFNVLWGDMSLVGPRPERPVFVDQFKKTIPNYMARHAVKAGLTGWAQVNGWRGNSSLRRRIQFDLYYITHWNPFFDLRIMVLTLVTMVLKKQKHAY
ncbi:undecaprenyl-phosphate glucose phosphotransferase [Limnoglobus roseus]|uniref:Undecaprenyl-phosphate glucose phosphotransferase n=1 Tax=Limnoglobus roseus TaxID=2598579 RepID=A0A5C1A943_9BACT|nr:undecaprenyl-phosphate glucose phosphotransferase [Limnoglobus roseus]QEL15055.1 undecaprenyl-phosphate glucose phosphotransferase [Limnoglobus roseus]